MKAKSKTKNNDWLYPVGFFAILFILGSCISAMEGSANTAPTSTTHPTFTLSNGSMYDSDSSTAQVQLTQDAQDAQILIWEDQATQAAGTSSCPNGCDYPPAGCDIKGNIGFESNLKIYHMPGQDYYNDTDINPAYGERWFCTEAEARANGWRKSQQ